MDLAAFDMEFGFQGRSFDYGVVVPVCGVLRIAGGPTVTACPALGRPWDLLRSHLDDPTLLIAMHHGVFAERQVLRHLGLPFPVGHFWDTEVVERVLHIVTRGDLAKDQPVPGNGPYTLRAALARRGVVCRDAPAKKALQTTIGQLAFAPSELPEIVAYCEEDVADTLTLARMQLRDAAQMPESKDTDWNWGDFWRRNNDELVATWGNLVNRIVSFTAKHFDEAVPQPGAMDEADTQLFDRIDQAFDPIRQHLIARVHEPYAFSLCQTPLNRIRFPVLALRTHCAHRDLVPPLRKGLGDRVGQGVSDVDEVPDVHA